MSLVGSFVFLLETRISPVQRYLAWLRLSGPIKTRLCCYFASAANIKRDTHTIKSLRWKLIFLLHKSEKISRYIKNCDSSYFFSESMSWYESKFLYLFRFQLSHDSLLRCPRKKYLNGCRVCTFYGTRECFFRYGNRGCVWLFVFGLMVHSNLKF